MSHAALTALVGAGQLGLGLVFALSAVPKLRRPLSFAANVEEYRVLPRRASRALAFPLIAVELALALAFLAGAPAAPALAASIALLAVFLLAVAVNLRRGRRVSCGCFGSSGERISRRAAARLLLLLVAAATLLLLSAAGYAGDAGLTALGTVPLEDVLSAWLLAAALLLLGSWALRLPEVSAMIWTRRPADTGQEVTT